MMEVETYTGSNGTEASPRFGMTLQSPKLSSLDGGVCPVSVNGRDMPATKATIGGTAKVQLEMNAAKLPLETSTSAMFAMETDDDSFDSEDDVAGSVPASLRSSPGFSSGQKMADSDEETKGLPQKNFSEKLQPVVKVEQNSNYIMFDDPLSDKEEEDPIECGDCDTEFSSLSLYMDHNCSKTLSKPGLNNDHHVDRTNGTESELSDVESFEGKIVYNPDGSAYIIEGDDSDLSESESMIDIKEGSFVDKRGRCEPPNLPYPQIANAFFVPKNPTSFFNNFYVLPSQHSMPEAPIMHSYRVYDVRKGSAKFGKVGKEDNNNTETAKSAQQDSHDLSLQSTSPVDATTVPTKPILMCFICKLSFGFAKSFVSHAVSEHTMTLNDNEKGLMSRKNASAIIQGVGKDKDPLISFLEPNPSATQLPSTSSANSTGNVFTHSSNLSPIISKDNTNVSYVYTKPTVSNCLGGMRGSNSPFDLSSTNRSREKEYDFVSKSVSSSLKAKFPEFYDGHLNSPDDIRKAASPKSPNNSTLKKSSLVPSSTKESTISRSHFSISEPRDATSASSLFYSQNGISHANVPSSLADSIMTSPGQFMGSFLGACDEHPQGRSHSVECPKCDMVLSSSRSLGGHMTVMHSRNSCKTLKCPKCNWHYKYQETLEIHMKEKHPESDTQCVYCITAQPHPRLARGETYTCGYKPYRCDVCNYSTTTKGNLSIHMQSDKHLNNMQELANGGEMTKMPTPQTYEDTSSLQKKQQKPKPTWRCDVCNYETNVARNLRIHMTSEKHTHNMMVLQQNMKHMQRDMHLQMNPLSLFGQQEPTLIGFPQLAPAGFPYDQFDQPMFLTMPGNMNFPVNLAGKDHESMVPPEFPCGHIGDPAELFQCCVCNIYSVDSVEALHQHMQMDRTKQREHENITVASGTYLCNLCSYKTNLKANFQLHCKTDKHLQRLQLVNHIREGGPSNEWRLKYLNVSNPVQVHCNSCDYYTNSIHKLQIHTTNHRHEANALMFRHLQISESRVNSDNKYFHCALCNFSSKTKLGLIQHIRSMKHLQRESLHQLQAKQSLGDALLPAQFYQVKEYKEGDDIQFDDTDGDRDEDISPQNGEILEKKSTMPSLLHSPTDLSINADANSITPSDISPSLSSSSNPAATTFQRDNNGNIHQNNNNIGEATASTSSSGSLATDSPITSNNNNNNIIPGLIEAQEQAQVCPYCNFSSVNEMRLNTHVLTQHGQVPRQVHCPLCQDEFMEKPRLEKHLVQIHNVTPEGLQRLMVMVDQPDWVSPSKTPTPSTPHSHIPLTETDEINVEAVEEAARLAAEDAIDTAAVMERTDDDHQYRCQTCAKTFCNIDALYAHQNELGHLELKQTPRGPGYLCWKKGCNQYFKTAQSLQIHFREIHAKKQNPSAADSAIYSYQCNQCTLAFKSSDKLQIHTQYHLIQAVTQCKLCNRSFRSIAGLRKHIETSHVDINENEKDKMNGSLAANALALLNAAGSEIFLKNQTVKDEVPREENKENPGNSSQEDKHNETMEHAEDSTTSHIPMETSSEEDKPKTETSGYPEYKEEQFMEDYINSQSIAEGSYDDPSRKYKCHRCKVAFTKQSYLTGHNKTLQHRKGDKLTYPMEKYLDPNRPYKCDVCKESFTQKNILLVHYNSVSHLHKLKQVAQLSTGVSPSAISPSTTTSSQSMNVTSQSSAAQSPSSVVSDSAEQKPFRCNICKVAYSQGSTLDIHMRSVLHQTRAAKVQELVLAGQIDPTLPLIEQPDNQKKILAEMLQPQQLSEMGLSAGQHQVLFPGFLSGFSNIPFSSSSLTSGSQANPIPMTSVICQSSMSPVTSNATSLTLDLQNGRNDSDSASAMLAKSIKSIVAQSAASTSSRDDLKLKIKDSSETSSHKKPHPDSEPGRSTPSAPKNPFAMESFAPNSLAAAIHDAVTKQQLQQQQHHLQLQLEAVGQMTANSLVSSQLASSLRSRNLSRFKPQVHKNLLENIGFECVMQFNEFNQTSPPKREKDGESEDDQEDGNAETKMEIEEKVEKKVEDRKPYFKDDLPEINKSVCTTCQKEFSSVWVLKSHEEEFHKVLVPIEAVEDFGEKFKTDYEKKQPKEQEQLPTVTSSSTMNTVSTPTPVLNSPANIENLIGSETLSQNPLDIAPLSMPMFNMMPMQMALNMPLAMNMHPPLIPMMMQHNMDGNFTSPMSLMDPNLITQQQKQLHLQQQQHHHQQQQQQQQQQSQNSKRARTRISDEQLKILRAHFDINNSPSEEQIITMSDQSGLPQKVIKHWFRNTLFKERQRNKDSPYNFNNPPSTQLNLEEYEKTGKISTEIKEETDEDRSSISVTPTPSTVSTIPEQPKESRPCLELPVNLGLVKTERSEPCLIMPPVTTSPPTMGIPMPSLQSPALSETSEFMDIKLSPSGCKRAIRTRFTDYQVKLLQEHFEQNAYPKDDDLDILSKLLNLSPRVIVVWFQNARQKARKSYENQPLMDLSAEEAQRRTSLMSPETFTCKKCSAVFQKHYELIRHQKNKCMPEDDLHSSSRTVASFSGEDDSRSDISPDDLSQNASSEDLFKSHDFDKDEGKDSLSMGNFKCEKCKLTFKHFEQWNEHQNVHMMNPTLFPPFPPGESAFAMLQSVAQQHENKTPGKRKLEESFEDYADHQRDKRLRTTILPEQLDYLYQKYQLDCSPSRKQLENISREVGLKKRVVQVWFQNTRARERKGQYRAHQQLIHKRCPFCRALFRAKSALESHLATKHPEEMAKGELNIDNIPDASMDSLPTTPQPPMTPVSSSGTPQNFDLSKLMASQMGMQSFLPFMSPGGMSLGFQPTVDPLQASMKKMYEDSLKKYMDELSAASHIHQRSLPSAESTPKRSSVSESHSSEMKKKVTPPSTDADDAPLDLSKPIKVNTDTEKTSEGPSTDLSERSFDDIYRRRSSLDDSFSETYSENEGDFLSQTGSNPTSPNSSLYGRIHSSGGKRYRTQMTNLQVRVMKMLFTDYKTPTMAECEMLGKEIGLAKRVVQVWFQNARAKEKKSKLAYQKTFGADVDFTRPPEDCNLCNFKYSHKYTVQDHIFTKKHIDHVKKLLQTQSDAERELSDPRGLSHIYQHHLSRDSDKVARKLWDESASPQLSQAHTLGLNSVSNSDHKKSVVKKENSSAVTVKKEDSGKRKSASSTSASSTSSSSAVVSAVDANLSMQMMSPFANFMPGMDPNMLSYMYPGMSGYYPGLGMPMMPPGYFPGAEQLFAAYDPTTYGTPLPLLQIPPQTIKSVTSKLTDPSSSLAQYTQDCKSFADLKTAVTSADYKLGREANVDVGYICKKCHMVYPGKEACVNHQRSMCFPGKAPDNLKIMLKLEQIQYECRACHEKTSTIHEFKVHCQMDSHKTKASKYRQHHQQHAGASASSQSSHQSRKSSSSSSTFSSSSNVEKRNLISEHPEAMAAAERIRAELHARLLANKTSVFPKLETKVNSVDRSDKIHVKTPYVKNNTDTKLAESAVELTNDKEAPMDVEMKSD